MKKIILLAIAALSVNVAAFAQNNKKEMSVKEYFLTIPEQHLKADAKKRAAWIETESRADGYLSYQIPVKEITGEDGDGKVWGNAQIFKKKSGGAVIGLTTNLCEEKICIGQVLFLDYNGGKWDDVTSDLAPQPDNDEVVEILKKAPAFEKKERLKKGVEVPLYIQFGGADKLILFVAGGENGDGGVVAKQYKWDGAKFGEFEYPESPE